MMRIIDVLHALRLRHIDLLRKMPIEKGIINIKLANSPLANECNAKHSTNGDGLYHGTESLVNVNVRLLVKDFRNKAALYHAIEPSGFCLMQNTHLLPTTFCPSLGGIRAQVLFRMGASYSSYIALTHLGSCELGQ